MAQLGDGIIYRRWGFYVTGDEIPKGIVRLKALLPLLFGLGQAAVLCHVFPSELAITGELEPKITLFSF